MSMYMTRGYYDFDGRMVRLEKFGETDSIHFPGHSNIGEDQIYTRSSLEMSKRLTCIGRLQDLEPLVTEEVSNI